MPTQLSVVPRCLPSQKKSMTNMPISAGASRDQRTFIGFSIEPTGMAATLNEGNEGERRGTKGRGTKEGERRERRGQTESTHSFSRTKRTGDGLVTNLHLSDLRSRRIAWPRFRPVRLETTLLTHSGDSRQERLSYRDPTLPRHLHDSDQSEDSRQDRLVPLTRSSLFKPVMQDAGRLVYHSKH